MRLLLDQNISVALATRLGTVGHDVVHARDLGLSRAEDSEIADVARTTDRVVVTFDADFPRLVALGGHQKPSVIHLRTGHQEVAFLEAQLVRALSEGRESLERGAVLVLHDRGYRLRDLPIQR